MEFITNSPEETEKIGAAIGKIIPAGTVLAYRGDLGAGKTAFTRGLARGLGFTEAVTSPTYTIVNEYLGGRLPLFHFDMYRLSSADDLFDIGWEDYLQRSGICAVEWSEIVSDALEEIGFEGSLSLETHIPNSVPDGAEREAAENKLFLDAKRLARR